MKQLELCLDSLLDEGRVHNIAVKIGKRDSVLFETYRSSNCCIDENTLFDMASVTKILATTSLCLIAFDKGILSLNDKVSKFFECDKQNLTVFNLLTHTMGIGHKPLNIDGNTNENIAEYILKIPCDIPIGTNVLYSCPGFILLGKILEKVYGKPLDVLFDELVCKKLGMNSTCFRPSRKTNVVNANSEKEKLGIVNDYNCQFLGGVAGNAGAFSTMKDMTIYAKHLLSKGAPIICEKTFEKAINNYTEGMSALRALGYLYVDESYAQTGKLFPTGSFGHGGHTGQSVFVNIQNGMYVIILSDATKSVLEKYGRGNYDKVKQMRADIHNAIYSDLSSSI